MITPKQKHPNSDLMPAIVRYDGVNFRVLRKARREGYYPDNLDLLIISAKYGLIEEDTLIKNYDLIMTRKRAIDLRDKVTDSLINRLEQKNYAEIFINLGKDYLLTFDQRRFSKTQNDKFKFASGGIGKKMYEMKKWLIDIRSSNS